MMSTAAAHSALQRKSSVISVSNSIQTISDELESEEVIVNRYEVEMQALNGLVSDICLPFFLVHDTMGVSERVGIGIRLYLLVTALLGHTARIENFKKRMT